MSAWQLGIAAALYLWVGIDFAIAGKTGMALAFFAYALANVGFIIEAQ